MAVPVKTRIIIRVSKDNQIAMGSNIVAMASNLIAMGSGLIRVNKDNQGVAKDFSQVIPIKPNK